MSDCIFVVQLAVAPEHEARFNDVYDTDHLTHMIQVPGVINCRRYELQWSDNTDMQRYLAILCMEPRPICRVSTLTSHRSRGQRPKRKLNPGSP